MIFTESPEINPNLTLDDLPGSFGDAVSASAVSALYNSPVWQLKRTWDDNFNSGGATLDFKTARDKALAAGVDVRVDPNGMTEGALNLLIERKRFQARTQDAIARGPQGFAAGSAYFLTGLGAAMLDPINLASAFIPVARGLGMAEDVARAGMLGEAGAAATAAGRAAARIRVGAVEGAVGQAMLEPLTAYRASQEQEDYGITDTLLNVGFGAVLGATAHAGLGALGDRMAAAERGRKTGELIDAAKGVQEKPVVIEKPVVFSKDSAAAKLQAADLETNSAVFRSEIAAAADGRKMDNSVLVPVVEPPERLNVREIIDAHTDASGAVNGEAVPEAIVAKVQEALDAGKPVTLFSDGKPIEITAVERGGVLQDMQGQRWDTTALVADPEGKVGNSIEIGGSKPKPVDPIKVQQAAAASHLPENDVHYDARAKAEVDRAVAERAADADPAEAVLRATQEAQTELATLSQQLGLDPEKNVAMRGADDMASTASRYSKAIEAYASCQVRS